MDWQDYIKFLSAVLPVFCAIGAGFWLRKVNWLSEAADSSLLRITNNVFIPALILDSVLQNIALKNGATATAAPLVGFGTVALGFGAGLLVARFAGKFLDLNSPAVGATFAFALGIYAYNYPPLALAKMLFGSNTAGVLLVHNLGIELFLWSFGLVILGVKGVFKGWKKFLNPPLIAVVLGLTLTLLDLESYLPRFLLWTINLLGQCAIPIGLISIGATLADNWGEFQPAFGWRPVAAGSVLRLGLLPMLFLLAARFLPFSNELKQVIVLQSAMPVAIVPVIPMVRYYGAHSVTAMRLAVVTSAISVFTMPLWIYFGMQFARVRF